MIRKIPAAMLLCAMAISAVIIIIAVSAAADRKKAANAKAADMEPEVKAEATLTVLTEIGYYLKEFNGELAVFRGLSDTPYKRLGVGLDHMTDEDRILLKEGLYAENEKKLKMLIEDYTS